MFCEFFKSPFSSFSFYLTIFLLLFDDNFKVKKLLFDNYLHISYILTVLLNWHLAKEVANAKKPIRFFDNEQASFNSVDYKLFFVAYL